MVEGLQQGRCTWGISGGIFCPREPLLAPSCVLSQYGKPPGVVQGPAVCNPFWAGLSPTLSHWGKMLDVEEPQRQTHPVRQRGLGPPREGFPAACLGVPVTIIPFLGREADIP